MNKQDEKSKKKRNILLILLLIIAVAVAVGTTYSRYMSTGTANAKAEIAKWQVKLNGENMSTTPITKDVELTYVSNDYVKSDKIAPGRKATFDITLDPTGSEVAIDYILKVDVSAITGISDANSKIAVTGAKYKIGNEGAEQEATITGEDGVVISETLQEVENGNIVTMTVTLEWDNNEDNLSSHDTANGAAGGTITVPVTVTAQQHI